MPERIADTLVLVFTYGMSLRAWRDSGMLRRELALYDGLLPRYARLVMVTYGGPDETEVLAAAIAPEHRARVFIICNTQRLPIEQYADQLPMIVAAALAGAKTAVVKTNQMAGGEVAVRIAEAIRSSGVTTALVARGGYLWTRFVAHEQGPHSSAADESALRERVLCQAADMVVGTTPDMVEDLAWRYHIDPTHTAVVPNYVIVDHPPRSAHERNRGLILYAGQLVPRKRVHLLIHAVSMLSDPVRAATTLEIIGEGPERASLEERAKKLGINVSFRSRIPHDQLVQRMSECAIYAQASDLEGHPKTVLEAMATGAPVVVADAPGLGDVVRHGVSGLRVAGEARSFAHAFEELLSDEDWRELLGSAAAQSTRAAVGLDHILELEAAAHARALTHASRTAAGAPASAPAKPRRKSA